MIKLLKIKFNNRLIKSYLLTRLLETFKKRKESMNATHIETVEPESKLDDKLILHELEKLQKKLLGRILEQVPKYDLHRRFFKAAEEAKSVALSTHVPLLVFPILFDEKVEGILEEGNRVVEHFEKKYDSSRSRKGTKPFRRFRPYSVSSWINLAHNQLSPKLAGPRGYGSFE